MPIDTESSRRTLMLTTARGRLGLSDIDFLQPLGYTDSGFPNPERNSVNYRLTMEPGSWTTSQPDDGGLVTESFNVFSNQPVSRIRNTVVQISQYLQHAKDLKARKSSDDEVLLVNRADGELDTRAALVHGGVIEELDDRVVRRNVFPDRAARFRISILRDMYWEHQSKASTGSYLWTDFDNHGGYRILTVGSIMGDSPGRVRIMKINPNGGELMYVWAGIKPASAGSLYGKFNPEIQTGVGACGELVPGADGGWVYNDTNFLDSYGMYVSYLNRLVNPGDEDDSEWRLRLKFPIYAWNAVSAVEANQEYYLGDYYLLCRYKTNDIGTAKIGVRVATGFNNTDNLTYGERIYLDSTDDEFRYLNLGKIRIGTDNWSDYMRRRMYLNNYRIYLESKLLNGDYQKDRLYVDNMYLVPADKFIYIKLVKAIGVGQEIQLFGRRDGGIDGYVTGKFNDGFEDLPTRRGIANSINEIKVENFNIPAEKGSVLVVVGDRGDGATKAVSATNSIAVSAYRRSLGYSE